MTLTQAEQIAVGDLIDIAAGPLAGHNAIVERVTRTLNTFSPLGGHYGGPALRFDTDLGVVYHYFVEGIRVKGWL